MIRYVEKCRECCQWSATIKWGCIFFKIVSRVVLLSAIFSDSKDSSYLKHEKAWPHLNVNFNTFWISSGGILDSTREYRNSFVMQLKLQNPFFINLSRLFLLCLSELITLTEYSLLQLTSTVFHVIGLASETDYWPIDEFLVKVSTNRIL